MASFLSQDCRNLQNRAAACLAPAGLAALLAAASLAPARAEPPHAAAPGALSPASAPPATAPGLPPLDMAKLRPMAESEPAKVYAIALPYLAPGATPDARERYKAASLVAASLSEQGDTDQAIRYAALAVDVAEGLNEPQTLASALTNLGNYHNNLGHVAQAAQLYRRSLRLARGTNNIRGIVNNLGNLGNLLLNADNPDAAIALLSEARDLLRQNNMPPLAGIPISITSAHLVAKRYAQALESIDEAARLASPGSAVLQAIIAGNRAEALRGLGRPAEAAPQAARCIDLAEKSGLKARAFVCHSMHGAASVAVGDLAAIRADVAAMERLFAALPDDGQQISLERRMRLLERRADIAHAEKDSSREAPLRAQILDLRGKVDAGRAHDALALAAAEHMNEGKDISIALLEAQNANLSLQATNARLRFAATAAGAALVGLLCVLALRSWRANRRLGDALAALNRTAELRARDSQQRARNDLQVLSALVNLHAARLGRAQAEAGPATEPGAPSAVLGAALARELDARLTAMAQVHAALADAEDGGGGVAAAAYLASLLSRLPAAGKTQMAVNVPRMPAGTAWPLGLLLLELLADMPAGAAEISLAHTAAEKTWELAVRAHDPAPSSGAHDPAPSSGDPLAQASLLRDLCAQLRGTLERAWEGGTPVWRLRFAAPA